MTVFNDLSLYPLGYGKTSYLQPGNNETPPTSSRLPRLLVQTFSLVENRLRFPAKTSVLVGNLVDAADFEEFGPHGCHGVEEVERVMALLQLQQARVITAVVGPLEVGLEPVAFVAVRAGTQ